MVSAPPPDPHCYLPSPVVPQAMAAVDALETSGLFGEGGVAMSLTDSGVWSSSWAWAVAELWGHWQLGSWALAEPWLLPARNPNRVPTNANPTLPLSCALALQASSGTSPTW